jgi:hypothetical protein
MMDQLQGTDFAPLQALIRLFPLGILSGRGCVLPHLAEAHPGRRAGGRWIGLRAVPTECIRGTASTTGSRGQDFKPVRGRAPADWATRWSRLLSAVDEQVILPPVQLIRAAGDYWVIDGHNRVALARERGQLWIDAEITEFDLGPGRDAAAAAKEN